MKLVLALIVGVGFSGGSVVAAQISSMPNTSPHPSKVRMQTHTDTPRYKAGYRAACDYATFGRPRDDFAYHQDHAYRAGWNAGYAACVDRGFMGNAGKKVTYN